MLHPRPRPTPGHWALSHIFVRKHFGYDLPLKLLINGEGEVMISFKGVRFRKDIILTCVRWYAAYPLSYRQLEEFMQERGVSVDHATINRWVLKYSRQFEAAFHRRKRPVFRSWRLDETCIRVRGHWHYPYCAMDKTGQTIDFLLTSPRDEPAAPSRQHGIPWLALN